LQAPGDWLNYNRYTYAMNSPMMYIDPNGEIFWLIPVLIGAVVGAYTGGVIANNGQLNPIKWNYSSGRTWGYMLGGAIVGAGSAYLGATIAAGGGFMSNTMSIAASSFTNSVGMGMVTDRKTPAIVSFGVVSYNFGTNEWGHLGKKGNKWHENVGYGLGAMANLADVVSIADKFFNGENKIADKANTVADSWEEQGHTMDNLNPNTVGNNLDGTSYMGGNNPMLENGVDYYYGRVPDWGSKEYAAYLHDVDYVNMDINKGTFSLFLGNKTLPADWSLAGRQLYLSLNNSNFSGVMWGLGMTTIAAYKTPLYLFRFLGIRW